MNIEQRSYVKWARPYLKKKNVAAMTKKRAIKIIMAATCCGNRRWEEDVFTNVKSKIAGKPRNTDVCYRVICYIFNTGYRPEYEKSTSLMARSIVARLRELYGPGIGGKLIDDLDETKETRRETET